MPTVAEQQALLEQLLNAGYDRQSANIAAGNQYFAGNPILAALDAPRQLAEYSERSGGDQGGPRLFDFPALSPDANPLTRETYETLRRLAANPGTPDEAGYDDLGRFMGSLVWGTPYQLSDYNDPNVRTFVAQLQHNGTLTDQSSFLGDNLFPVLALFGVAAGGAALAGGYGAAGGAGGATAGAAAAGETGSLFAPGAFVTGEAAAPSIAGVTAPLAGGLPASAGAGGALAGTGTATAPSLFSQVQTLANTPLFEGGPSASQVYQGGSLINSAVNTAQDPSTANVLGLVGSAAPLAGSVAEVPAGVGQGVGAGLSTAGAGSTFFAPATYNTTTNTGLAPTTGGNAVPTTASTLADYAKLGTTLYGVGTGLYDRFGGGGSEAESLASLQGDIAKQLFTETTPLRGQSLAQLFQYLQTGVLPPALLQGLDKAYATGRTGLEDQYSVARENILGRVPSRGGQLNSQLADLEAQRANSVGRLGSDLLTQYELPLRNTLFASATGLPFGQAGQALGNIGQSAGTLGQIEARNAQAQFQQEQAIGSLLASLFTPQTAPAGTSLQPSLLERLFG